MFKKKLFILFYEDIEDEYFDFYCTFRQAKREAKKMSKELYEDIYIIDNDVIRYVVRI